MGTLELLRPLHARGRDIPERPLPVQINKFIPRRARQCTWSHGGEGNKAHRQLSDRVRSLGFYVDQNLANLRELDERRLAAADDRFQCALHHRGRVGRRQPGTHGVRKHGADPLPDTMTGFDRLPRLDAFEDVQDHGGRDLPDIDVPQVRKDRFFQAVEHVIGVNFAPTGGLQRVPLSRHLLESPVCRDGVCADHFSREARIPPGPQFKPGCVSRIPGAGNCDSGVRAEAEKFFLPA